MPRATTKVRSRTVLAQPNRPTLAPVRTSLPRYSKRQLTSTKILSQRSAVPAVVSRATTPSGAKNISRADKERLLRIAKRPRKGSFNDIMDPTHSARGGCRRRLACRQTQRRARSVGFTSRRRDCTRRARDGSKAHDRGKVSVSPP